MAFGPCIVYFAEPAVIQARPHRIEGILRYHPSAIMLAGFFMHTVNFHPCYGSGTPGTQKGAGGIDLGIKKDRCFFTVEPVRGGLIFGIRF